MHSGSNLAGNVTESLKHTIESDDGLQAIDWCGHGCVDGDPSSLAVALPQKMHIPYWCKKAHAGIHIEPTLKYVEGLLAMITSDYQRPEGNENNIKQQGH